MNKGEVGEGGVGDLNGTHLTVYAVSPLFTGNSKYLSTCVNEATVFFADDYEGR